MPETVMPNQTVPIRICWLCAGIAHCCSEGSSLWQRVTSLLHIFAEGSDILVVGLAVGRQLAEGRMLRACTGEHAADTGGVLRGGGHL